MLIKINLKSEEVRIGLIILLTTAFFLPATAFELFSEYAVWAIALYAVVMLAMLASLLIGRRSDNIKGLSRDERTEKFSLKASRNGFVMAVILTALLAASAWLRGWSIGTFDLLVWIWMWVTGTYGLSYLYYVMRG